MSIHKSMTYAELKRRNALKIAAIVSVVVLLASTAFGQTPSRKLQWDQSEALATVQGFSYTLQLDAATPSALTPTCVVQGTGTRCTAPYTIPANLPAGNHTLTLTAFNGFGQASATLTGTAPSAPISVSVTVTVTIP